ncbi:MAG: alpha-amylase family glycosyl hydrolase [Eubacteriales bacterium]|nr:alpha-amylase family glycosyl hydrolase [Eubacteriales bacterium]
MAWYDEAVFYHIYPLGLSGAPKTNSYGEPAHRLNEMIPWIGHIRSIGCSALYIGPLFESVGHGYETTDYKKLDSRLGTNEDLAAFVAECHRQGIKVIFDGVFNHTGRDFFAFQDLKSRREQSPYRDWYCNVNFGGNNEYNDGFSYENWGGYNLLVKLNQRNPAVRDYICDVIRFWVSEFDVDGIRLDAADVLDFDYMKALRRTAEEVKPEFWLMGEVIHGDYSRWVNEGTLHSVTNYQLHKALYSGHNDHNYFEIAHTVRRLCDMGGLKLYNFVDNHDVERIYTKLVNKAHFAPVHVLLYTLPGIPSIYYGSEFGIEGKKERFSDDSLRPALKLSDYADAVRTNQHTRLIAALGTIRRQVKALSYGDYRELLLTNRQYAFSRTLDGVTAVVAVNNDDGEASFSVPVPGAARYRGALTGRTADVRDGRLCVTLAANSGEIWLPEEMTVRVEDEKESVEAAASDAVSVNSAKSVKAAVRGTGETAKAEAASCGADGTVKAETAAQSATPVGERQADAVSADSAESVKAAARGADATAKEGEADAPAHEAEKNVADAAKRPEPDGTEVPAAPAENVTAAPVETAAEAPAADIGQAAPAVPDKPYEEMTVPELQLAVLEKLGKNGPITDQMRRDVAENVYRDSLLNWVRSFR